MTQADLTRVANAGLAPQQEEMAARAAGRRTRARVVHGALVVALLAASFVSLTHGAVRTEPRDVVAALAAGVGLGTTAPVDAQLHAVLLNIRLPRVLLGALVGAALGICGAAMQGLFRNPLADPALIGVSAGASAAVVAFTVFGRKVAGFANVAGTLALPLTAFLGSLMTTIAVYRFSVVSGRTVVATMLLAGIGVNALAGALTGLLIYLANDDQLRTITFWSLGSLGGASWKTLRLAAPFLLLAILCLPRLAVALNAMVLGEAEASHLGVDVERTKRFVFVAVALGVGAAVAVSGVIGFVGLVVPHVVRLSLGSDNRHLLAASALLGAGLLVCADLAARTLVVPAELPIGILMALLGAPWLLWLLQREQRRMGA